MKNLIVPLLLAAIAALVIILSLTAGSQKARAADLPPVEWRPAQTVSAAPSWSCGAFERLTKGLLYDNAGFLGTKQWTSMSFAGCSQVGGGWDFDVISFVPLAKDGVADEVDFELGHTWTLGNFSIRAQVAYWNFEPFAGTRFNNIDSRVQMNYRVDITKEISLTPWLRVDHQEIVSPTIVRPRDTNVAIGMDFTVTVTSNLKLLATAAHFYHPQSFGTAHHVTAVTVEAPFSIGKLGAFGVSAGPWYRATWGNILGAPGNNEFNQSFGLKVSAFN